MSRRERRSPVAGLSCFCIVLCLSLGHFENNVLFSGEGPEAAIRVVKSDAIYVIRGEARITVDEVSLVLPDDGKVDVTGTAEQRLALQIPDGLSALDDVIVTRMKNRDEGFLFAAVANRKADKRPMLFWAIGHGENVRAQAVVAYPSDKGSLRLLSAENVGGDIICIKGTRSVRNKDGVDIRLWTHMDFCAIIASPPDTARPFSVGQWKEFELPKSKK